MVGDPRDLIGVKTRIDRVQDRADAHRAEPGFHMAGIVPGQRCDPVAHLDAVSDQRGRHLFGAQTQLLIGRALDRPPN